MGRHRWYIIFSSLLILLSLIERAFSCPFICVCKWKGGKETVECIDKGVATLPDGIDVRTQVLDFSGNNLQSLRRHAFLSKSIINLQRLHLRKCNLGNINKDALKQLTNLVEFDLSNNLLTKIPSYAFRHIPALRVLNLANNPITSIPGESFVYIPALVYLDLSNARISYVSPLAFKPLSALEKFQIEGNKLKEIPNSVIESLENAHEIKVHHNPWLCDCRALPLWKILEIRKISHPVSPTCKVPYRISGRKFENLQEDDFACPPEILPIVGVVRGVAGENATVTCKVEGQPSPDVMWYIEDRHVVNGSILGLGPQRAYILNVGEKHKVSHLVITGAQEGDSGQVRCIATNPAGQAEANFTLAVTMRSISSSSLNAGHIAGISVSLVVLALIIFIIAFLLFARSRTTTTSPTPVKEGNAPCVVMCSPLEPNPIQKPPRLTDLTNSNSNDPDLISEAEKIRSAYSNGHIPNGHGTGLLIREGDFSNIVDHSLYGSTSWDPNQPILHEHYNPAFTVQESPIHMTPTHSTPFKVIPETEFDPQIYGYPSDYGLPIPEVDEDIYYDSKHETLSSTLTADESPETFLRAIPKSNLHISQSIYEKSIPFMRPETNEIRIQENRIAEESTSAGLGRRSNIAEGAASPHLSGPPAERPWIPGSQSTPAVPMGVPVLPPLPTNAISRIKARDSPDEGYQEGTEV